MSGLVRFSQRFPIEGGLGSEHAPGDIPALLRERLNADSVGPAIVVAVSGGADSVALLIGLADIARERGLRLHVGHIDHALRPESAADAEFVGSLAASLDLPFSCARFDVAELARRRRSGIEETARHLRLKYLGQLALALAGQQGVGSVALGHTADDQVESVLLHLTRGAGLRGLGGMAPTSEQIVEGQSLHLWRPLLGARRSETHAFCESRGIRWRDDPTNADVTFARNRVRHEIVPILQKLNPRTVEAVMRLAAHARDDEILLEQVASEALASVTVTGQAAAEWERRSGRVIKLESLRQMVPPLRRRVMDQVAHDTDPTVELRTEHYEQLERWLFGDQRGATLEWPGGIRLTLGYETTLAWRAGIVTAESDAENPVGERPVSLPGSLPLADGRLLAAMTVSNRGSCGYGLPDRVAHIHAPQSGIVPPLIIRSRRPGDRFRPAGGAGTRKVSDLLIDAKVPRHRRDHVPIVADQQGILWVAGMRADQRAVPAGPDDPAGYVCLRLAAADE